MAGENTQAITLPTRRRESTFLSLSPLQSSPPASPVSTKTIALPVSGDDAASSIAHVIEPLEKLHRTSSESSTSSISGSFLRLNPVTDE